MLSTGAVMQRNKSEFSLQRVRNYGVCYKLEWRDWLKCEVFAIGAEWGVMRYGLGVAWS